MLRGANLAVRFLLEVGGVLALAYWGFSATNNTPVRIALGIGAPALLVVIWAFVVAPGATNPIPQQIRMVAGTALLEVAAGALLIAGQGPVAIACAAAVMLNAVLMVALGQ